MSGLAQYTRICDSMIQAAPSAVVAVFARARLVLRLAQDFYSCFDTILSIIEDMRHLFGTGEGFEDCSILLIQRRGPKEADHSSLMPCVDVVEALIKQTSRIHIIVDGLDECQDRQGFSILSVGYWSRRRMALRSGSS